MVFFPLDCKLLSHSTTLYLICAAADGSGPWQLHFPYRSMAVHADRRWLWIFDAAPLFSPKRIIDAVHTPQLFCLQRSADQMKVFRERSWWQVAASYITWLLVWLKKKPTLFWLSQAIERRFQQTSVNCVGTPQREVRSGFIEPHGLILNLLLLRTSASPSFSFLDKKRALDRSFHGGYKKINKSDVSG